MIFVVLAIFVCSPALRDQMALPSESTRMPRGALTSGNFDGSTPSSAYVFPCTESVSRTAAIASLGTERTANATAMTTRTAMATADAGPISMPHSIRALRRASMSDDTIAPFPQSFSNRARSRLMRATFPRS